jgi:hypothetical protein
MTVDVHYHTNKFLVRNFLFYHLIALYVVQTCCSDARRALSVAVSAGASLIVCGVSAALVLMLVAGLAAAACRRVLRLGGAHSGEIRQRKGVAEPRRDEAEALALLEVGVSSE